MPSPTIVKRRRIKFEMRRLAPRSACAAILGGILFALLAFPQAAQAEGIKLCPPEEDQARCLDYPTIQQAVDAAEPNSVISLTNGIYTEANITIAGKKLVLRGQEPQKTIIQASSIPCLPNPEQAARAFLARRVLIATDSDVKLENLTIQHGCLEGGSVPLEGAGIWSSGSLSLKRVVMISNTINYTGTDLAARGGGIASHGLLKVDSSTFLNNEVRTSSSDAYGGAIYSDGLLNLVNSTFGQNRAGGCPEGASAEYDGAAVYSDKLLLGAHNTLVANESGIGGRPVAAHGLSILVNNLLSANTQDLGTKCILPYLPPAASSAVAAATSVKGEQSLPSIELTSLLTDAVVPVYRQLDWSDGIDAGICLKNVRVDQVGSDRGSGTHCDLGSVQRGKIFLPRLLVQPRMPDLRVADIKIVPEGALDSAKQAVIEVTIENVGLVEAHRGFWVDLFINPRSVPPNYAGTVWSDLCRSTHCVRDRGISWKVETSLQPSERLTLTSRRLEDPFIWLSSTNWTGTLPAGPIDMWAYVDSWNGRDHPWGWIMEIDESDNRYAFPQFLVRPGKTEDAIGGDVFPGVVAAHDLFGNSAFPGITLDRPLNR